MPTTAVLSSSATDAYRAGEECIVYVKRPSAYTSATKGVVFVHGYGVTAESVRNPAFSAKPIAMAGADLPVFAFDFGNPSILSGTTSGPDNWGNDNAVFSFYTVRDFLAGGGANGVFAMGSGCATGTFLIYAGSMGAITALNYLISEPTPSSVCAGVILLIPTLDLDDIYQNDKGGFRSEVGAAYGVTHPTALPGLATHSPVAYSAPNKAKLSMPIKIWASSNDTIGSTTSVCQTWASSVGGNVSVVDLGAVGHTALALPTADVLSFFGGL